MYIIYARLQQHENIRQWAAGKNKSRNKTHKRNVNKKTIFHQTQICKYFHSYLHKVIRFLSFVALFFFFFFFLLLYCVSLHASWVIIYLHAIFFGRIQNWLMICKQMWNRCLPSSFNIFLVHLTCCYLCFLYFIVIGAPIRHFLDVKRVLLQCKATLWSNQETKERKKNWNFVDEKMAYI